MNDHRVHRAGDIEFGITEAISLATVKSGISFAGGAARSTAKVIKSLTPNKGSIAKMARDYVMQFPVLASSSIPEEDLAPIVKNFEIQYAQFIAMVLQGRAGINVKDIDSTADILKQLHSNEDAPNLLDYAMDITGGRNSSVKGVGESVQIGIPESELQALAFGTDAEFTMENLNSMYQPNKSMLDKYERVTAAMESGKPSPDAAKNGSTRYGSYVRPTRTPSVSKMTDDDLSRFTDEARYNNIKKQNRKLDEDVDRLKYENQKETRSRRERADELNISNTMKQNRKLDEEINRLEYENRRETRARREMIDDQKFANTVKQNRKLDMDYASSKQTSVSASDLNKIQNTGDAPTVLTATLYLESEAGVPEPRTVVFGVKCMTRAIPSSVMVPNVTDCIASNTWAFRFVKWTKGEIKFFRDILFDITNARNEAINDKDPAGAWFNSVKRRKRNSKWFGSKTNISPVMTLIITDEEAEAIKAQTGIDLTDDRSAAKLMKDMYLLGFAIYHTANGNLDIMLDKYSNGQFYNTTMTGIRASNKGNSNTDLREINKLLQNGGYIR